MASRSLNKVQLIGNLTRDPELRYTPQGTAVCTFGLATNRSWTTESGEKREETEFHRIVAWNKLAELCSQLLFKGRRVFVEGRLQTRSWTAQDGAQRQATEIVIEDMIILDNRRSPEGTTELAGEGAIAPKPAEEAQETEEAAKAEAVVEEKPAEPTEEETPPASKAKKKKVEEKPEKTEKKDDQGNSDGGITSDEIPF